jgi:hypothetical protein
MKIFISAILLLISTSSAFAINNWNYMACYGADTRGNPVSLTVYSDSPIVTINGDRLMIVGKTVNGKGLVTENFIAVNGMAVYDSIVPYSATNLNIFQFNAVTQQLLATADLSCRFYGNAKLGMMDQQIFKPLIK